MQKGHGPFLLKKVPINIQLRFTLKTISQKLWFIEIFIILLKLLTQVE
jgi:hypothetical protein